MKTMNSLSKVLASVASLAVLVSLAACGSASAANSASSSNSTASTSAAPSEENQSFRMTADGNKVYDPGTEQGFTTADGTKITVTVTGIMQNVAGTLVDTSHGTYRTYGSDTASELMGAKISFTNTGTKAWQADDVHFSFDGHSSLGSVFSKTPTDEPSIVLADATADIAAADIITVDSLSGETAGASDGMSLQLAAGETKSAMIVFSAKDWTPIGTFNFSSVSSSADLYWLAE
jgi:hypothetical protein